MKNLIDTTKVFILITVFSLLLGGCGFLDKLRDPELEKKTDSVRVYVEVPVETENCDSLLREQINQLNSYVLSLQSALIDCENRPAGKIIYKGRNNKYISVQAEQIGKLKTTIADKNKEIDKLKQVIKDNKDIDKSKEKPTIKVKTDNSVKKKGNLWWLIILLILSNFFFIWRWLKSRVG